MEVAAAQTALDVKHGIDGCMTGELELVRGPDAVWGVTPLEQITAHASARTPA